VDSYYDHIYGLLFSGRRSRKRDIADDRSFLPQSNYRRQGGVRFCNAFAAFLVQKILLPDACSRGALPVPNDLDSRNTEADSDDPTQARPVQGLLVIRK
jgi:hypothetical protein